MHGQIVNGMTQPVGCETILDDISATLPRPMSTPERAGLLAAIRDRAPSYTIPVAGKVYDVMPTAARFFAGAADVFAQKLKASIPQAQRAMISAAVLVGGTAYAVGEALAQRIPILRMLPRDHEFANLIGNARKHGLIGEAPTAKTKKGR
jgi:hypothetical protein